MKFSLEHIFLGLSFRALARNLLFVGIGNTCPRRSLGLMIEEVRS